MMENHTAETAVDYLEGLFSRAMSGRSVRDMPEAFGAVRAEVARLRAALAVAEGAAIPDGWALVPREATLELEMYRDARMYDALMEGAVFKGWNRSALDRARRVTEAAMLAARPAPEQTP